MSPDQKDRGRASPVSTWGAVLIADCHSKAIRQLCSLQCATILSQQEIRIYRPLTLHEPENLSGYCRARASLHQEQLKPPLEQDFKKQPPVELPVLKVAHLLLIAGAVGNGKWGEWGEWRGEEWRSLENLCTTKTRLQHSTYTPLNENVIM